MINRAIVLIGASNGGLDPLRRITEGLRRNVNAAVFVAMHESYPDMLPEMLGWHANLPVLFGQEGAPIASGHIYVAPPDHHMLLETDRIRINHGPRIHSVRPAADLLFGSAAEAHGRRVIGVVLSGAGCDGAAGLDMIKRHGGCALVEDPRDAPSPSMPEAALAADAPECLRIDDLARRVADFCQGDDAISSAAL